MSLQRNLAANYLGQAWVAVVGVVFLPLYVHYLGAEALGLIGVFTLLQAWLSLLDLGITPTLTREMARFKGGGHTAQSIADLLRSLETVCASVTVAVTLVLWVAAGYLARDWLQIRALPVDVVSQALGVMGLVVALRFCEGIYRGALLGLHRQVLFNSLNVVLATLRFGGAVAVLAFVSPTIQAFYLWQAMVSIAGVAVLAIAVHRSLPRPPQRARASREALAAVRSFAGGMVAITMLSLLVSQVDKILLSRLLPLEQFGYYTLAATMASVLSLAVAPILQSVYPTLVKYATSDNPAALAHTYHQVAQLVSITTVPLMLLLTWFSGGVIYVWTGDVQLAARTAPLLLPLALGSFLNALMALPYQTQLAHGWTSLTIKVNTIAVVTIVPAILWAVPRYGGVAAAWIWVTLNAAYVLVAVQFMHRRILKGEKRRWYLDDIAAPAGGAAIVALLLALLAPPPAAHRLWWAAFLAGAGLATTISALLLAGSLRPRAVTLLRRLAHA